MLSLEQQEIIENSIWVSFLREDLLKHGLDLYEVWRAG